MLSWFIDLVLHLDRHLVDLVSQYHYWVYGILFAMIFAETGLVVTPFLPGDSLLFATGALAAVDTSGTLNAPLISVLLGVAAVLGNTVQLRDRPLHRSRRLQRSLSTPESGIPAAHRGVLRALRRDGGFAVALHAHHPHLHALRRRHRPHALRALPGLQRRGRLLLGDAVHLGRLPVRQHPPREAQLRLGDDFHRPASRCCRWRWRSSEDAQPAQNRPAS